AYTIALTPLMIQLIDQGRPVDAGLLADRLIATLVGAALVVAADAVLSALSPPAVPPERGRRTAAPGPGKTSVP
ncbi:hypothetical protein J8J27_26695, partial [Mycobacterium tuberculosis]|nr:hypothetical protein [Mycobacterium tuberculosis]